MSPLPVTQPPAAVAVKRSRLRTAGYHLYRALLGAWKFIVGVAFTQTLLFSFAVAGWTCLAAQRSIVRHWWKAGSKREEECFCDFVQCSSFHRGIGGWPNWILENDRAWMRAHHAPGWRKVRVVFRSLAYSLWLNLKIGVQLVFNTFVLTLPGCALMLFAWYAGWHNSFNKGYEQAVIGPVTGIAGIIAFIAAMYYVPMAQMRQASTGDWRTFYQFRTVWQLIRKRWLACFGLAVLFSLLSVPVTILKTVPQFFPQINQSLVDLPPDQALRFAKTYYFYAAFVFLACYIALRLIAARVYASSILASIQSGAITEDALAEREWEMLHRLDLLKIKPQPARHVLVRTVAWFGTKVGRATIGSAIFLAWFTFISQVYISEFVMKSELGRGWLNQPLVQLPWFNYIPLALEKAAHAPAAEEPPQEWGGKSF